MAVNADKYVPASTTLSSTTVTRIVPGDDVRLVWVSCDTDMYLVYDETLADGGSLPATARFRIPANTLWPIEIIGVRPHIAAASGTPTATVLGVSSGEAR